MGPIPFRFNPLWLQEAEVKEIVQKAWNSNIYGSPSYIWESKLREVHYALKKWEKVSFKGPTLQQNQIQEDLATLQRKMEREEVITHYLNQEKEMNMRILKAERQEEEEWRLKSRQL